MTEQPRHRRELTQTEELFRAREERAYQMWCREKGFDPEDNTSARSYEGNVGYLYLDEPTYIGEHL